MNLLYPALCQICSEQRATAEEGYVCHECWSGRGGVQFIQPPFCDRCGLPLAGEITATFVCGNCQDREFYFRWARSAVVVNELVLEIIHRYKYKRALWFEPFLADLLVRQAYPVLTRERWDLIVPVPLYPTRQREREFNQAERLGQRLSQATLITLNTSLLRRSKATTTQTQLSRNQRSKNMIHAFQPCRPTDLAGQRIVLVDDVLTTGATTSACARVLRDLGASDICVWTVARGI